MVDLHSNVTVLSFRRVNNNVEDTKTFVSDMHLIGLIDADDPVNAAQRELKEETGYSVPRDDIRLIKLPVAYEPGLTNSCCYVAKVTINVGELTAPPVQELEPDEWSLQTISLPLEGLMGHLLGMCLCANVSGCRY